MRMPVVYLFWYTHMLAGPFDTRQELWEYAVNRGFTEAGHAEFRLAPGYSVKEMPDA